MFLSILFILEVEFIGGKKKGDITSDFSQLPSHKRLQTYLLYSDPVLGKNQIILDVGALCSETKGGASSVSPVATDSSLFASFSQQKPIYLSFLFWFLQVMVNGEKERVSLLFMKALVSRGSVDAVSQQMASHPQYLESFLRTQHYILHMDGPLPLPYRHYIAIMVGDLAADIKSTTG